MSVFEIFRKSSTDGLSFENPFVQEIVELWRDRGLKGTVYVLKETRQDRVAAFLLLEQRPGKASIIRGLYTYEDFRRQGCGSYLIRLAVRENGQNGVIVNITAGAEKVYQKLGFKVLGRREDFKTQSVAVWGDVSEEELEVWKSKLCPSSLQKEI